MKLCAYCKSPLGTPKHQKTDEHIIPNSLLKLYPEQDISFHNQKRYVDNRGMTISDVCSSCNNGTLSELDSYGKMLIETTFLTPYVFDDYYIPFDISLDTPLFTRWLLKIAYNSIRCEKFSTMHIEKCIPYILGNTQEYPKNVSILLGLHINLNPVPEDFFAFTPLQIMHNPIFFLNSYIACKQGASPQKLLIKGAGQTISIRTGNAISLIILWKDSVSIDIQKQILSILQEDFRFRLLEYYSNRYSIRSVSSPTNVMAANYGHFYSEQAVSEIIHVIKESIQGRDIASCKEEFSKLWTPEMNREGRAFVEASMFPNNSKKQKILEDIIRNRN